MLVSNERSCYEEFEYENLILILANTREVELGIQGVKLLKGLNCLEYVQSLAIHFSCGCAPSPGYN